MAIRFHDITKENLQRSLGFEPMGEEIDRGSGALIPGDRSCSGRTKEKSFKGSEKDSGPEVISSSLRAPVRRYSRMMEPYPSEVNKA